MSELRDRILCGDVRERLAELPDESVHCVVTSPPYWGLRDYGVPAQVWGGDPEHRHEWVDERCRCGAWLGQLGLEPSVDMYVDHVVNVFREVGRVLRSDGTLWLNMGDSYVGSGRGGVGKSSGLNGGHHSADQSRKAQLKMGGPRLAQSHLKRKDLVGQAWRVALALQRDGWWLRSDIIWEKPSVTPESAKDRPTKSHDYLFLMCKSVRYYFDAEAINEPVTGNAHARGNGVGPKARKEPAGWDTGPGAHRDLRGRYPRSRQNPDFQAAVTEPVDRRNTRTVWKIPAQPFSGAHFATFPEELACSVHPRRDAGSWRVRRVWCAVGASDEEIGERTYPPARRRRTRPGTEPYFARSTADKRHPIDLRVRSRDGAGHRARPVPRQRHGGAGGLEAAAALHRHRAEP